MPSPTIALQLTRAIGDDPAKALDGPGVYALFWACPSDSSAFELVPICTGVADTTIRVHIALNVLGSAETSLIRAALGLMLRDRLGLILSSAATATGLHLVPEQRLTDWLSANTVIGYAALDNAVDADGLVRSFETGEITIVGISPEELARRLVAG